MYHIQLLGYVIDKSKYEVYYDCKVYKVIGYCLYDISTKTTKYITCKGLKKYFSEMEKTFKNDCNLSTYAEYLNLYLYANLIIVRSSCNDVLAYRKSIEHLYSVSEGGSIIDDCSDCKVVRNSAIFDINTGLFKYDHLKHGYVGMLFITQGIFGKLVKFLVKHDFSNCEDSLILFNKKILPCNYRLHFNEMRLEYPYVRLRGDLIGNVINIQVEDTNYLILENTKCNSYVVGADVKKAFVAFMGCGEYTLCLHSCLESLEISNLFAYEDVSLNIITSRNIKDSVLASIFYKLYLERMFKTLENWAYKRSTRMFKDLNFLRDKYIEKDYRSIVEYDNKHGIGKLYSNVTDLYLFGVLDVDLKIQYLD